MRFRASRSFVFNRGFFHNIGFSMLSISIGVSLRNSANKEIYKLKTITIKAIIKS